MSQLRQAAQQALEALETCSEDEWHSDNDFGMMQVYDEAKVTQAITVLRAALAEPEQEPDDLTIAYMSGVYDGKKQRKPLTEQEIQTIWAKTFEMGSSANTFARAIERAHGIKEQEHE